MKLYSYEKAKHAILDRLVECSLDIESIVDGMDDDSQQRLSTIVDVFVESHLKLAYTQLTEMAE